MKEATTKMESALEYCKIILNAESEEEIVGIKAEIVEGLRSNGSSEEFIQGFLLSLDSAVERLENENVVLDENGQFVRSEEAMQGEQTVLVDENGQVVRNEETMQEGQAIPVEEAPVNTNTGTNTMAGVGLGLTMTALVASIALKKKIFKNRKNKGM